MTEFDAYLTVDWSASNRPAAGADSIWYCLLARRGGTLVISALENPSTRWQATRDITDELAQLVGGGHHVLVGFDFPYCYPAGFAHALGLTCGPPWKAVWREIAGRIVDRGDNANNRFEVAAEFNRRISGVPYPFWGCPKRHECATLSRYRDTPGRLPERRVTERYARSTQPVWKLAGAGAVGSQALVGIPYVLALRDHPVLGAVSRVWPFETGLKALPSRWDREWLILHAEIYPSLLPVEVAPGEVKDTVQVRNLAQYFARLDEEGRLSELFAGLASIERRDREQVESEEGWILGVADGKVVQPELGLQPDVAPTGVGDHAAPPSSPASRSHLGSGRTTVPGYENRNGQVVVRATSLRGTDHGQYVYVLRCLWCNKEYGANGSDIFQRRCPQCQGGRPGLAL